MTKPSSGEDLPHWWPAGCAEQKVRECNCQYCHDLADALNEYRDGKVNGNATLDRFAQS
jgi:hypothetical protein